MTWTAILPLKAAGERKTRLASMFDVARRDLLAERLLSHAARVLHQSPLVSRLILLTPAPPAHWDGEWLADTGGGLNVELERARAKAGRVPLMVLNADLPFLNVADVAALAAAGSTGRAIAPDRHARGTNAVALGPAASWSFAFGPASFAAHHAQGAPALVDQAGLAFDLDTPEDLALASARGFLL